MRSSPLADAAVPELMSYTVHPLSGRLPDEGWQRIRAAGGTCLSIRSPQPLERHFPDFATIPATPRVRDWSMIRYDIDARAGRAGPAVLIGTGNRALDGAAVKAIRESRFTKGRPDGVFLSLLAAAGETARARHARVHPHHEGRGQLPRQRMAGPFRRSFAFPNPIAAGRSRAGRSSAMTSRPLGPDGQLKVIAAEPSR